MLEVVFDCVGDPGNAGAVFGLGAGDVGEPLLEGDGLGVAVATGMGERFVDVEKLDALVLVIVVDGLQTGDLAQEREVT